MEKLVRFVAHRTAGADEVDELAEETLKFVRSQLPQNYDWPGNFRELEQCVRNIMVHGEYVPHATKRSVSGVMDSALKPFLDGEYTLNQLMATYVSQEYRRTPNLTEVGVRLDADRRTVKKYLNNKF